MEAKKPTLTHWKRFCNPDYLGAYALEPGEDLVATIQRVDRRLVKGEGGREEECTVAEFKEPRIKPMILNRTNCKTIAKLTGSNFIEHWPGCRIQIFVSTTKLKGDEVECLRIRPQSPRLELPDLTPNHEKWAGAVSALAEGRNDLNGIRKFFAVSDQMAAKLLKEADKCRAQAI